jgi:nitrogen fixation protein FixH
MFLPCGLLGLMLVGWGYMVSVALDDPSFSVEENYYEKAIGWDDHQAQEAKNQALGWHLATEFDPRGADMRVSATLLDRHGAQLSGATISIEAFPVARGGDVVKAVLRDQGDGSYGAVLPMRRPGIWELRYTVEHGGERFTLVQREELVPAGAI